MSAALGQFPVFIKDWKLIQFGKEATFNKDNVKCKHKNQGKNLE